MDKEALFNQLIGLLEDLSVKVKYDRGNFTGGLFRYHKDNFFYVNRKEDIDHKLYTIINELKQLDIPPEMLSVDIREAFPELIRDT